MDHKITEPLHETFISYHNYLILKVNMAGFNRIRIFFIVICVIGLGLSAWFYYYGGDSESDIQSMFQGVNPPIVDVKSPGLVAPEINLAEPSTTNGPRASLSRSEIERMENLAQLYYKNQLGERDIPRSGPLELIKATYPCLYGKLPIGLDTKRSIQDGHKYVCGLHTISQAPIVYSFGSNGQQDFEEGILKVRSDAKIYSFELVKSRMVPEAKRLKEIQYFNIGLAYKDLNLRNFEIKKEYNLMSLTDIMKKFNHSYIDILKMDIEGYEIYWLRREKYLLNRVGQLLVEFHSNFGTRDPREFIETVERYGMMLFNVEHNILWAGWGVEYSFMQGNFTKFNRDKVLYSKLGEKSPTKNAKTSKL